MARRMVGDGGGEADRPQNSETASVVLIEHVQGKIRVIRGQKVILDADLAELYGVTTKRLNEQVKRCEGRSKSAAPGGPKLRHP